MATFPKVVYCTMSVDVSNDVWVHHNDPELHDMLALALDPNILTDHGFLEQVSRQTSCTPSQVHEVLRVSRDILERLAEARRDV
jgi:hypothetical protein